MVVPLRSMIRSFFKINFRLTPRRIRNAVQLYASMYLARISGKPIVWGYPLMLMVEPTNICNLKCPMCPSGNGDMKRPVGKLDLEQFRKLMDEVGPYIMQVQLWNQGEPFINKDFLEFVQYARLKGVMTQTSTNGHYIRTAKDAEALVRSGLDILIFSMDGTNQETYEKYRVGGKFGIVMEALRLISEAKKKLNSKTPIIELQFLLFKHNRDEIDEVKAIGRKFKVDRLSLKTAQVYTAAQAEEFLPEEADARRYDLGDGGFEMKGEVPDWCKRLWLNSTVNWDGSVSPCCFDKDAEHAFANIFENGTRFTQVWKNSRYNSFRRQIMSERKVIEMCRNCTEGLDVPYAQIIEMNE